MSSQLSVTQAALDCVTTCYCGCNSHRVEGGHIVSRVEEALKPCRHKMVGVDRLKGKGRKEGERIETL